MGDQYSVGVSGIALVATTVKTIFEAQGSSLTRGRLKGFAVSFNGITSDVPVLVEVLRATGGITGTTIVPAQVDPAALAMQGVVKHSASAEGTPVTPVLESHYVTPNGGLVYVQIPLMDEYIFTSASFIRVRCTAPSNETCAFTARIWE